jgi:hypothetical protein
MALQGAGPSDGHRAVGIPNANRNLRPSLVPPPPPKVCNRATVGRGPIRGPRIHHHFAMFPLMGRGAPSALHPFAHLISSSCRLRVPLLGDVPPGVPRHGSDHLAAPLGSIAACEGNAPVDSAAAPLRPSATGPSRHTPPQQNRRFPWRHISDHPREESPTSLPSREYSASPAGNADSLHARVHSASSWRPWAVWMFPMLPRTLAMPTLFFNSSTSFLLRW